MGLFPSCIENNFKKHNVCLILEGFEEKFYFDKILKFPCFSKVYNVKTINAKTASNIPIRFQEEYAKNIHEIVLVVCDKDRKPEQYDNIVEKLDLILGPGLSKNVIYFTSPCTLQVILSHFSDVKLVTQAKKECAPIVKELTDVDNYDAHEEQIKEICSKIHYRTYDEMKNRIALISGDPNDIPSTNLLELFQNLESDDVSWISDINNSLSSVSE